MTSGNLPWLLFKAAAKTTCKGGAITLTSTMVSCALACYIERGAHRAVYHYFPEKYANVDYANGLTQDQLNAVRVYRLPLNATTELTEPHQQQDTMNDQDTTKNPPLSLSFRDEAFRLHDTPSTATRPSSDDHSFWREDSSPSLREKSAPLISWKPQESFRAEILACSMTG